MKKILFFLFALAMINVVHAQTKTAEQMAKDILMQKKEVYVTSSAIPEGGVKVCGFLLWSPVTYDLSYTKIGWPDKWETISVMVLNDRNEIDYISVRIDKVPSDWDDYGNNKLGDYVRNGNKFRYKFLAPYQLDLKQTGYATTINRNPVQQ